MTESQATISNECLTAVLAHAVRLKQKHMIRNETLGFLAVAFARLIAAYIHRNPRAEGELDESYRFRATLPSGETAWAATPRELAERILRSVEGMEKTT